MTDVTNLKPLTSHQYDTARAEALKRVQARIGVKPERKHFKREMGPIATPLDYIALVVFVAALAVSSAHIITFMTGQAVDSFQAVDGAPGVQLGRDTWAVIHQIGLILLAESAAILFMTMHTMTATARAHRAAWNRWISIPLILAALAAVFVLMANLASGVNVLVSLMPPVFTLGIAVRLEAIIAAYLRRRDAITNRYIEAFTIWELASKDTTKHPDFMPMFRSELWQAIVRKNRGWEDAPSDVRRAAVIRELERETWAYDEGSAVLPLSVNGHGTALSPLTNPTTTPQVIITH